MPNYAVQEQNQDMVSLLSAYFRLLYNPVHAFADNVAMLRAFPGIVDFWIFGNSDKSSGQVYGNAQSRHLTNNNSVPFGWSGLAAYADLDGVNQYFSRADETQLDMTAANSTSGVMTFGWFNVERLATAEMLICKRSGATTNYNYYLFKTAGDLIQANIWNGAAQTSVSSTAITALGWYFLGMIWNSSKLSVFVNGTESSNTTSIPATSNNSTAPFTIGADGAGATTFQGLVHSVFLGQRTAQVFMTTYYQMTAPLFGISI